MRILAWCWMTTVMGAVIAGTTYQILRGLPWYDCLPLIVLDVFKTLNATSRNFNDEVISQLPKNLRASASDLTKPVFESLEGAIGCFSTEGTGGCFNVTDPLANATQLTNAAVQVGSRGYFALAAATLALAFVL